MYSIVRFYQASTRERDVVRTGLTLEEAQEHCADPETSSSTCEGEDGLARTAAEGQWFDGYTSEGG